MRDFYSTLTMPFFVIYFLLILYKQTNNKTMNMKTYRQVQKYQGEK